MMLESSEIKKSIRKQMGIDTDPVGNARNLGLESAIKVVEMLEEFEGDKIAEALNGRKIRHIQGLGT